MGDDGATPELSILGGLRLAHVGHDLDAFAREVDALDRDGRRMLFLAPYAPPDAARSDEAYRVWTWDESMIAPVDRVSTISTPSPSADVGGLLGARAMDDIADRVAAIVEEERRGECYLLNFSVRMATAPLWDAEHFVRCWAESPSRYGLYLDVPGVSVMSFSPERFMTRSDDWLMAEPIKGTALIGDSFEESLRSLWSSEKERRELVLVTDLLRHDLHRVCEAGTVGVYSPWHIRRSGSLLQMQSFVVGHARSDLRLGSVLRGVLPAGSVTGAPKRRVCEIIAGSESTPRGYYTGVMGWTDGLGNMDSAVLIRSHFRGDLGDYCGSGAGITVLSDPVAEAREIHQKLATFALRGRGAS